MIINKKIMGVLTKPYTSPVKVKYIEMRHQYWGPNGIVWSSWYKTKADTPRKPYQGTFKNLKNEYREL